MSHESVTVTVPGTRPSRSVTRRRRVSHESVALSAGGTRVPPPRRTKPRLPVGRHVPVTGRAPVGPGSRCRYAIRKSFQELLWKCKSI